MDDPVIQHRTLTINFSTSTIPNIPPFSYLRPQSRLDKYLSIALCHVSTHSTPQTTYSPDYLPNYTLTLLRCFLANLTTNNSLVPRFLNAQSPSPECTCTLLAIKSRLPRYQLPTSLTSLHSTPLQRPAQDPNPCLLRTYTHTCTQ
jgi:hypothetical protein